MKLLRLGFIALIVVHGPALGAEEGQDAVKKVKNKVHDATFGGLVKNGEPTSDHAKELIARKLQNTKEKFVLVRKPDG